MRRGFTLVEMMFALAIFTAVLGGLGVSSVFIRRMIGQTYAASELSITARLTREKILFHDELTQGGKAYAGLLSGADLAVAGQKTATASARAMNLVDGMSVAQPISLSLAGDSSFDDAQKTNHLYFVELVLSLDGVTHAERIAVPVFGTEQVKNMNSVFHDTP